MKGSVEGLYKLFKKFDVVKHWQYYLMALPALLVFSVFTYLPMPGIIMAFKDFNFTLGIFKSPWNGIENFKFYFSSVYFGRTTFNTFWINFNNMLVGTILTVTLAILLNEVRNKYAKRLYQNFLFLPYFISAIVVGRFVGLLFNSNKGLVNQLITFFHGIPIDWSSTPAPWVAIIVGAIQWKGIGYGIIIYLAAIIGIDSELYEAASIDGASKFRQIRYITMPLLVPTIIILTLLGIGRIFYGDFQTIYAIVGDNGRLMPTTDIVETFLFRSIRTSVPPQFGMAAAVGLYQSLLGFLAIFGSNWLIKKYNPDYSLF